MPQYDARLELAPRDVVARSIQDQMLKRGESHVLRDVSNESADKVHSSLRFQPIFQLSLGFLIFWLHMFAALLVLLYVALFSSG